MNKIIGAIVPYKLILFTLMLPVLLFSNLYSVQLDSTESQKIEESIDNWFNKKDYEKACQLVDVFYKENPYDVQANLYYGKCAYYRGDIDAAMAAYDRAEILDEEDASVHKHLGDLHAHIGNIEIANSEYDKADRFGKDIVERALDSAYSSNTFSLLARFSGGYDSNVQYNAENSDIVTSWDPNSTIEPASDSFIKEYARITHLYDADAFSSFYYKSQLHFYNKNYSEFSEEDFTQAQVYTGPGWASKDFDFWMPLSYTYMATDYEDYATLYTINPQIRKKFENELLLRAEAEYQFQEYKQWDEGDKDIYSADISLSRWFGRNYFRVAYRYLQVDKHQSDTTRRFIDKYFNEAEINYALLVTKSIELGVGYLYNKTLYGDVARVGETAKREDALQKFSAYMSYNITRNIGISINYDNYDNETNYTPSAYKKEVISGGVYFYY